MIIIYTYKDEFGKVRLDYGVDTKTDQKIILLPEVLDCDKMGIKHDIEGRYYWIE